MTPRRVSRVEAIAAVAALPAGTAFVGIDGFGAAGKTSLAAAIAATVPGAAVVHADDFARPTVDEWDWDRFIEQVLVPLRAGRPARYQVWDWDTDTGGEWVELAPGRVVVVEGVSSTRREVPAPWALTIWVEAPREVRLARARERDGAALMPRWLEDWMPSEDAYAARERPQERVDLIVDGTA